MANGSGSFDRPRTAAELVAANRKLSRQGEAVKVSWPAEYPESFFRLMLKFACESDQYVDEPEIVRESSPLFWDPGTAAQILIHAAVRGGAWRLALTRWGVLRWEYLAGRKGECGWVESGVVIGSMARIDRPFDAGVTISRIAGVDGEKYRVRLLVGEPGEPMVDVAEKELDLPAGVERPQKLIIGQGPGRYRPTKARTLHLLVANTELHQLYQGRWQGSIGVDANFNNGSALACRLDERTLLAFPGVDLKGMKDNYWHHFTVTDRRINRLRFGRIENMSSRFYGSMDRRQWFSLPARQVRPESAGGKTVEVVLPERKGKISVANCPVYDESRRAEDIATAKKLGAKVHRAAVSRGGLPLYVVELTNFSADPVGKVGVAMICGQHSPVEQMTGFLGLPLLAELAKQNSSGPNKGILNRLAFYWTPIFNIDCCRRGLPGTTLDGANPNRRWFDGLGPEQKGIERFFIARRREGIRLGLMLDCHAGSWRNHTVLPDYMLPHKAVEKMMRYGKPVKKLSLSPADRIKLKWLDLLDRFAGLREVWDNGLSTGKLVQAPHWFQTVLGCPAMTFECSMVSCLDPKTRRSQAFSLDAFRAMGKNLAGALLAGMDLLIQGASFRPKGK